LDSPDGTGGTAATVSEFKSPPSIEEIDARLAAAQKGRSAGANPSETTSERSATSLAFRIAAELVSALAVSVGIGWLLDHWLGTRPWLMVAMFFLGAVAGVLNVYRAVEGLGGRRNARNGDPSRG
jgi:ATP synthase protein I